MWELLNKTPYQCERTWVRDKRGAHQWIVVVKATFDIATDGETRLSEAPAPPLLAPEYTGEDGSSSLRYEADMTAMKPGTDIVLNAAAHAPGGHPVRELLVSFSVGEVEKRLMVYGDRTWTRDIVGVRLTRPEPFTAMPIVCERAFGGYDKTDPDPAKHKMDSRNPFGTGCCASRSHLAGQRAPNIEHPGGRLGKDPPAGFGAIPSFCSPRLELAGTYDEAWQKTRLPLLPNDWSPLCLLCAPEDQRPVGYLRGGEPVQLFNLTPSGFLRFELPRVYPTFSTRFGSKAIEHRGKVVIVIIEPDHPRVIMVWQTALEVQSNIDDLDQTVIEEKHYLERP